MSDTEGASAPEPSAPPRPSPPHRLAELVERWWQEHFPGSPVAQATQAWNHAFAAKESLKRLIKEGN
jgi:hypothetical protein